MPFEFKMNVDLELANLFGEFEAYVPGPVIGELKRSGSKHTKVALAAGRQIQALRDLDAG